MIWIIAVTIAIFVGCIVAFLLSERIPESKWIWNRSLIRGSKSEVGIIISSILSSLAISISALGFWYLNLRICDNVSATISKFEVSQDTTDVEPELFVDLSIINLGNRSAAVTEVQLCLKQLYPDSILVPVVNSNIDNSANNPSHEFTMNKGSVVGFGVGDSGEPFGSRILIPSEPEFIPYLVEPGDVTTSRYIFGGPLRYILDNSFTRGMRVIASIQIVCITSDGAYHFIEHNLGYLMRISRQILCYEYPGYPMTVSLTNISNSTKPRGSTLSLWYRVPDARKLMLSISDSIRVELDIPAEKQDRPFGIIFTFHGIDEQVDTANTDTITIIPLTGDE